MTGSVDRELRLEAIQYAWLQELGIDRAYLSRLNVEPTMVAHPTHSEAVQSAVSSEAVESVAVVSTSVEQNQEQTPAPQPRSLQESINALRRAANIRPTQTSSTSTPDETVATTAAQRLIPDDLAALEQSAAECVSCALHQNRSRVVFGKGRTQTVQWFVLADAPSDADDKSGIAIDGHTGALLDEMLGSVGLNTTEHCYVTHMVKCRSLEPQGPDSTEIQACSAYLLKQIELLQPQYILALGQQVANQLLGVNDDIEQLRSKIHHWQSPQGRSLPVVVTYHPASLLLRPQHKANAWRDLALVKGLSQNA